MARKILTLSFASFASSSSPAERRAVRSRRRSPAAPVIPVLAQTGPGRRVLERLRPHKPAPTFIRNPLAEEREEWEALLAERAREERLRREEAEKVAAEEARRRAEEEEWEALLLAEEAGKAGLAFRHPGR